MREVEQRHHDHKEQYERGRGVDGVGPGPHCRGRSEHHNPEVRRPFERHDGGGADNGVGGIGDRDHGVGWPAPDLAHLGDLVLEGLKVKGDGAVRAPRGGGRALEACCDGIAGVAPPKHLGVAKHAVAERVHAARNVGGRDRGATVVERHLGRGVPPRHHRPWRLWLCSRQERERVHLRVRSLGGGVRDFKRPVAVAVEAELELQPWHRHSQPDERDGQHSCNRCSYNHIYVGVHAH